MGLAPFRPWHDFFHGSGGFAKPDLTKWNNRVISNLLYYQTNYFVVAIVVFLTVGFLNPLGMFLGGSVMTLVLMAPVRAVIKNFIKKNPTLFIIGVMGTSYFWLSLGGVVIFMLGLTLPLLLILVHASLRLRNLKNRLENKMDGMRSPMGIIMDMLDQQEEKMNKIQDFIESKM